jgi:hypothetical protein
MTIAIVMVSLVVGLFLGYKVGYFRCSYQFSKALEAIKVAARKQRK